MAKKIIQMYDKYQSTTKVYPKIIKGCLEEDVTNYIEGQVEANPTVAEEAPELTSLKIKGTDYKLGGGGKQLYQHNIVVYQNDNNYKEFIRATFTIINDNDTPLNKNQLLCDYFREKFGNEVDNYEKGISANGRYGQTASNEIIAVCLGSKYEDLDRISFAYLNGFYINYVQFSNLSAYPGSIKDTIIPL